MIEYRCECGAYYQLSDDMAGRSVECGDCGKVGRVAPAALPPTAPPTHLPPVADLLGEAFQLYKKRLGTFLLLALAAIAALVAVAILVAAPFALVAHFSPGLKIPAGVLCGLAGLAAVVYGMGWCYAAFFAAAVDPNAGVKESFRRARPRAWSFAWLGALAGVLIVGASLLFILPGIMLTVWFFFAPFILADPTTSAFGAMMKSRELVRGQWWAVAWRLFVVWFLLGLISAIPVAGQVFSLLAFPFGLLHSFRVFTHLQRMKQGQTLLSSRKAKAAALLIGLAGFIAIPAALVAATGGAVIASLREFAQRMKEAPLQVAAVSQPGMQASAPASAGDAGGTIEARHRAEIDDPASPEPMPNYNHDNKPEMDLTQAVFESDGNSLHITLRLKEPYRYYLDQYQGGNEVASIYIDTDNDASTGDESFQGDLPGFEWRISVMIGLDYGAEGGKMFGARNTQAKLVGFIPSFQLRRLEGAGLGGFAFLSDEAMSNTQMQDNWLRVTVPYEKMQLKSGQTVRISTEKETQTMQSSKLLPTLLLKLK